MHTTGVPGHIIPLRLQTQAPAVHVPAPHMVPHAPQLLGSRVVSVHAPLTAETEGMIGPGQFAAMKPTACLVNTARGPVVDETALTEALRSGRIAGAALDVFAHEPIGPDSPLAHCENVVLTPHTAWYSEDSEIEIRTKTARNVVEVAQGRLPTYLVNHDVIPGPRGIFR